MNRLSDNVVDRILWYTIPLTPLYPTCIHELKRLFEDYTQCQRYYCKWQRLSFYRYAHFRNSVFSRNDKFQFVKKGCKSNLLSLNNNK